MFRGDVSSVYPSGVRSVACRGVSDSPTPGRGSVTWRVMGDVRTMLMAPTALILQVAHPVVGAGVAEHSTFLTHPWGRLLRTLGSAGRYIFGDDLVAGGEAERLRRIHLAIRGVDERGRAYRALDPDAYAWVHLTLFQVGADSRRYFATPLTPDELDRLYAEWGAVGVRLGVRPDRIPSDLTAYRRYLDRVVTEQLEMNRAVRDLLDATRHPLRPEPWLPERIWEPVGRYAGQRQLLVAAGTLPPAARRLVGLPWSAADQAELDQFAARVRRTGEAVPPPLRYLPHVAPYVARAWARDTLRAGARRVGYPAGAPDSPRA